MPGLPSRASETESPTGWTKQLISVAWIPVPAAELIRPAGTKPFSSAQRKRAPHISRRSAGSASASARATRARTSAMVLSSPLAYFSSSTSVEMSCGASAPRKIWSFAFMSWLIQMERFFPVRHAASDPPAHSLRQIKLARTNRIPTTFGTPPAGCDTMPVGRASSHGGAVNLVRSGTKQPQPFSISAEGQARPPYSFAAFLRGTSS